MNIVQLVQKSYRRFARPLYLVGIAIGALLLLYQAVQGFQSLKGQFLPFGTLLKPLVLVVFIVMITIIQQVVAWYIVMRGLGFHQPFIKLLHGYIISFLPRYIPGVFWGYLSRNTWLVDAYQVSYKKSSIGSLIEVIVGFVGIFMVFGIYLTYLSRGWGSFLVVFYLFLLVIGSWWFFNRSRICSVLLQVLFKSKADESFSIPFSHWFFSVGILALNMILNGLALNLIGNGLTASHEKITLENIIVYAFCFCLAYLFGFIIFLVPAGMGLRELSLAFLLVNYTGMPSGVAGATSVLFRLMMIIAEIIWLLMTLFIKANDPGLVDRVRVLLNRQN